MKPPSTFRLLPDWKLMLPEDQRDARKPEDDEPSLPEIMAWLGALPPREDAVHELQQQLMREQPPPPPVSFDEAPFMRPHETEFETAMRAKDDATERLNLVSSTAMSSAVWIHALRLEDWLEKQRRHKKFAEAASPRQPGLSFPLLSSLQRIGALVRPSPLPALQRR